MLIYIARVAPLLLMAAAAAEVFAVRRCEEGQRCDPEYLVSSLEPKALPTSRLFLPRTNINFRNRIRFLPSHSLTKYHPLLHLDQDTTSGIILTRRRRSVPLRFREDDGWMVLTDSSQDVLLSRTVIQAVEDALRVGVRDNHVVLLHDDQPDTRSIVHGVMGWLDVPLILVDLKNPSVTKVRGGSFILTLNLTSHATSDSFQAQDLHVLSQYENSVVKLG